ncbi:MAG: hypothetical protein HN580_04860 [Deltaproteobacteria bacterium]|jgi:hypothetical protein|nr:hypothetical protein [Deltaproteobacteria bacterium]MBT4640401.1 hypothetical protein [Deltaproteobacteria bacterium]MBT7888327.1 hypothetical protein [Deltaproteobacteria bacterium]
MKILKVGDIQKAACNSCESFTNVTFKLRDVPFSDASGIVKNVLVGVCDQCDSVAVLPHQSTPAVKKELEVQRKALESRVPAHMIDILNLVCVELSGGTEFIPSLMKHYIHSLSNNDISSQGISELLNSDLAKGKAQKRLSLKGRFVADDLNHLKEITNIKSTTDLIKGIVLRINDDVLVKKKKRTIEKLKMISAAIA